MQNYSFGEAVGMTAVGAAIGGVSYGEMWGVNKLATNLIPKAAELSALGMHLNIQESVQVVGSVIGILGLGAGAIIGAVSFLHVIAAPFVAVKEAREDARNNWTLPRRVPTHPRRRM